MGLSKLVGCRYVPVCNTSFDCSFLIEDVLFTDRSMREILRSPNQSRNS
jgi:hypothetical protein